MPEPVAVREVKDEVAPFQYKEMEAPALNPVPVTLTVSPTLPETGVRVNVVEMITLNERLFERSLAVETLMTWLPGVALVGISPKITNAPVVPVDVTVPIEVKSKYNVAGILGVNVVASMTIELPGGPLMALLES